MRSRQQVLVAGLAQPQFAPALDMLSSNALAADSNQNLTVAQIMGGILYRSGLTIARTDTWPSADALIAAMDNPQVGDTWGLAIRVNEAFAINVTLGTGLVAGIGTTASIAASSTRHFRFTVLSNKRTTIKVCTTTNADPNLTKVPLADLKDVMPGMEVTGTGIGAAAIVLGVQEYTNAADGNRYGRIVLSVNSTATADNIPVTFNPRIQVDSYGIHGN